MSDLKEKLNRLLKSASSRRSSASSPVQEATAPTSTSTSTSTSISLSTAFPTLRSKSTSPTTNSPGTTGTRVSPTSPSPDTKTSISNLRKALARADSESVLPIALNTRPSNDQRRLSSPSEPGSAFSPRTYAQRRIPPTLTIQQATPPRIQSPPTNVTLTSPPSRTRPLAPPTPISGANSPTRPSFETVFQASGAPLPSPSRLRPVDTPPTIAEERTAGSAPQDYFGNVEQPPLPTLPKMGRRKIWIKRAGASPTLVQITEDDLVDDVRDMVLRKYANSLGRNWDAPDVTVRLVPRERSQAERVLGPEEPIASLIDACFPGGQHVEEALLIDVPRKRTPLPSPGTVYAHPYSGVHFEDTRPLENGNEYFPPMAAGSPHPSHGSPHEPRHSIQSLPPRSIGILETGQLPPLPSPQERRSHPRPKAHRQNTSSPTALVAAGQVNGNPPHSSQRQHYLRMATEPKIPGRTSAPHPPPLPDAPVPEVVTNALGIKPATSPLDRVASPPGRAKKHKKRASMAQSVHLELDERRPSQPHPQVLSVIEATVPPINVLIVEDNPLNLKLLEQFTKSLKVRWSTAMNGRDAVSKWRTGGFHLVLMDIQLPIMSGLEATKEIRRLERVNGIGVFAKGEGEDKAMTSKVNGETKEESAAEHDRLESGGVFRSPVIIVALTASSLQSDRHEALAAGCNDFLTKPVSFQWLERKIMEWGCMQALVDYEGFRKWKILAAAAEERNKKEEDLDPAKKEKREKKEARRAAALAKMGQAGGAGGVTATAGG